MNHAYIKPGHIKPAHIKTVLLVIGIAALSASGGYWLARRSEQTITPNKSGNTNAARPVLYWYDPMSPTQHFDHPGKSPFMDMPLVPKYANEDDNAAGPTSVRIDPGQAQNLSVRLRKVQRGVVAQSLTALGSIGFNQRDVAIVQTRSAGFVTKVYQRAVGDIIKQGAPLVDLLMPEWTSAQAEFLALLGSGDQTLITAARQRLLLLGMTPELIAQVEHTRQPQTNITIRAPIAGVITSLEVRTGMTLNAGTTLATINGINTMWLEAALPEGQGGLPIIGQTVTAQLAAYPGETFHGRVIAILPEINADTRTTRVRVQLPNVAARLRPGQFAQVHWAMGDAQPVLFIPSEAVIRSGTRNIVIVASNEHRFEPVAVTIGAESQGRTIVLAGLTEGQQVVSSGQFLIDSEANLQGVLTRLNGQSSSPAP